MDQRNSLLLGGMSYQRVKVIVEVRISVGITVSEIYNIVIIFKFVRKSERVIHPRRTLTLLGNVN